MGGRARRRVWSRSLVGVAAVAVLAGGGLLAVSGPAGATGTVTLYVTNSGSGTACTSVQPCGTIGTAITDAGAFAHDAVTITVGAGTYDGHGYTIAAGTLTSLVVVGRGPGTGGTQFDGVTAASSVFIVMSGTVSFSEMSVTNGDPYLATGNGGGIRNEGATVHVTDVFFATDHAHKGGGLSSTGGTVTIDHSAFFDDRAATGGGAHIETSGTAIVTSSLFEDDSAGYGGGFTNTGDSTATLTGDTFLDDSAPFGGAIDDYYSTMTMSNVVATEDTAEDGGGVYEYAAALTADDVTFSNDDASHGGGVYNDGYTLTMSGGGFFMDSATYGGGLYNATGTSTLTGVGFSNDVAFDTGPDYYVEHGSVIILGTATPVTTLGTIAPSPSVTPPRGAATRVVHGTQSGNLDVAPHTSVFLDGGTVTGSVLVPAGSSFAATGGEVEGNVISTGGVVSLIGTRVGGAVAVGAVGAPKGARTGFTHVCASTIGGDLSYEQSAAPADLGGAQGCRGNEIEGSLFVEEDAAPVSVQGNSVGGDIVLTGDAGGVLVHNHAGGTCSLGRDRPQVTGRGNTAGGADTCNAAR